MHHPVIKYHSLCHLSYASWILKHPVDTECYVSVSYTNNLLIWNVLPVEKYWLKTGWYGDMFCLFSILMYRCRWIVLWGYKSYLQPLSLYIHRVYKYVYVTINEFVLIINKSTDVYCYGTCAMFSYKGWTNSGFNVILNK